MAGVLKALVLTLLRRCEAIQREAGEFTEEGRGLERCLS